MANSEPSINELMEKVKASIEKYKAERGNRPRLSLSVLRMADAEIAFTSRTADQEVDTVEICPEHPEYMIIGTYSLLKKDDPCDYIGQMRRGTIQVMPVLSTFKPKYAGMLPPQLDKAALPCAVLDIHFHPSDGSLLGVATSNAQMHFYRFVKHGDVLGRRVITKLIPLGKAAVAEKDEFGLTPLVTQFTWFPEIRSHGVSGISDVQDISFAITTSFGDTKVIKTSIPAIKDLFDARLDQPLEPLDINSTDIHKHDLEAWTVAMIPLRSSMDDEGAPSKDFGSEYRMILSGGDDSALIASAIDQPIIHPSALTSPSDTPSITVMPLWKDRRSHNAGVVAIIPLPRLAIPNDNGLEPTREIIPLVTGSYDEFLRVYEIDPRTYRATFKTELRLNGGVWRLKVLDEYDTTTTAAAPASKDAGSGPLTGIGQPPHSTTSTTTLQRPHHVLLLASLMHAGAAILRLTYSPRSADEKWTITREASFRAGHESMVYSCDATRVVDNNTTTAASASVDEESSISHAAMSGAPPEYTVVSTSFYDNKICTWQFVDRGKLV